jgi:hypothetical protein
MLWAGVKRKGRSTRRSFFLLTPFHKTTAWSGRAQQAFYHRSCRRAADAWRSALRIFKELMKRILLVFALSIVLLLHLGCISPSCFWNPAVYFILPQGHRGVFRLVLSETKGVEVKPSAGRYTYEVPKSGVLLVKSFEPLDQCHAEYAAYADGTQIPTEASNVNSETIALRGGIVGSKGNGPLILTKVIGTDKDWNKVIEDSYKSEFYDF